MLFALHIEVAHKLVGMAPAAFFEYATGLSHMNYRRGRGYTALMAKREQVEAHSDSLLLRMLQKRGIPDAEFRGFKEDIPQGHSAIMLYGLGLLNEHTSPATRELVAMFDASDKRLCKLSDTDVYGFLDEIGPRSQLGPAYCTPLTVADIRDPSLELKLELTEPERTAINLALNRRAHMALSFLAALDHEIGHWIGRTEVPDAWAGLPRFAVLLAPPGPTNRRRHSPADPAARLVDFIGAVGYFLREGSWPERPLSIEEMGAQVDLSGIRLGESDRFLRSLRSGKAPLTRKSFRTLVHTQLWTPKAKASDLDDQADLLETYLVAALLLSLLLPDHPTAAGHMDRTGWPEAYLGWWERHRHRYPPTLQTTASLYPSWLIDP
ncbi:hypothetical protein [Stenotrophomonas sp. PS02289]|uniref:hypothetical protein n=1 Tax=Stenotrophomonas sp. PS02289 TaxID=2991422 RepID=UPI002499CD68|nr:hypothetical protein [Stenotrophomonas sp. PS02289]